LCHAPIIVEFQGLQLFSIKISLETDYEKIKKRKEKV